MQILPAAFGGLFVTATLLCFLLISKVQHEPYMDEIFHVPQAQSYCSGNFSHWDPMLTTLPGLYLTSIGLFKPVAAMLSLPSTELCSTFWLRSTNVLFAIGNFYLVFALLKKIHNPMLDPDGYKLCMTTLALSTFPVLYFFTFLYYTDAGSTFFVLIMYLYYLHDNHVMAAILGMVAILFRQTNIVWVVFMAGMAIRNCLKVLIRDEAKKKDIKLDKLSDFQLIKFTFNIVLNSMLYERQTFKDLIKAIIRATWPYICVVVGFLCFIYLNNGIVVGDRTQHTTCLNFPQMFYFLSLTNVFAVTHLCSPKKVWEFLKFCLHHPFIVISFIIISAAMIYYYTYEHVYLLADNRHYTFYIWARIFRRHEYVKFALIPPYLYCAWSVWVALSDRDIIWKLVYIICLVVTTVPQKLLEFRYFILPYLIFRMNMRYGTAFALLHEIVLYIIVNAATMYLFMEKPFKWPHDEAVQRFMW